MVSRKRNSTSIKARNDKVQKDNEVIRLKNKNIDKKNEYIRMRNIQIQKESLENDDSDFEEESEQPEIPLIPLLQEYSESLCGSYYWKYYICTHGWNRRERGICIFSLFNFYIIYIFIHASIFIYKSRNGEKTEAAVTADKLQSED